jgi:hypothetical protein
MYKSAPLGSVKGTTSSPPNSTDLPPPNSSHCYSSRSASTGFRSKTPIRTPLLSCLARGAVGVLANTPASQGWDARSGLYELHPGYLLPLFLPARPTARRTATFLPKMDLIVHRSCARALIVCTDKLFFYIVWLIGFLLSKPA